MRVFSQRIAEGGILPWLLVIAALLPFVLYVKGFICFIYYIYIFYWHLSHSRKNVLHYCQKNNETKRKSIHLGLLIADC